MPKNTPSRASQPARPAAPGKPAQVIEEIRPGQSMELLKELHILTREGKLNQDTRRKLKQVYHLYQFIAPLLEEVAADGKPFTLADHGAGKSYLGFILYDLFFNVAHAGKTPVGKIYGIETRAELVDKSRELAQRLGFANMAFLNVSVQQATSSAELPAQVDIVTALHACDTATDDAIAFGLHKQARHMVLVPCCQAEVAGVLRKNKALSLSKSPLAELWRHPLHTREFGSQITNVLRCLQLEAHGYQVTVTELVGWEHSMKNELILASRPPKPSEGNTRAAQTRLQQVLTELNLRELTARFASAR
ncbi:MAG: SAM-dependent methyltransferase [Pseudomonadota bacterium]|uniref:class I SAM-dependent methyltransferase n=1 Tax=Polaromonas sp. TaxID=1869339 RepID=UPI00183F878E|nr:SAM-dependent methyltransferase [Polaromonas sp.]MBA3592777.1 SAM-dependent methyltransferase [Polaromonas sp.]MDQ3270638.1 SAM-dependent methyltransferase [Pseudomonadota bacterium]